MDLHLDLESLENGNVSDSDSDSDEYTDHYQDNAYHNHDDVDRYQDDWDSSDEELQMLAEGREKLAKQEREQREHLPPINMTNGATGGGQKPYSNSGALVPIGKEVMNERLPHTTGGGQKPYSNSGALLPISKKVINECLWHMQNFVCLNQVT